MNTREHAIALLEFTRSYTNNLMKDIPESQWTHQPSPTDNHVLWCLGHIAGADAWMAGELGIPGVEVPETILKAFGMKSKPSPSGNPGAAEVKRAYDSSRDAIIKWLRSAPDSALAGDLRERTGGFAADPLDMIFKIAWHEGFHAGQIANIRKALQLPATM